jgi:hypothetical protein
MTAVNHDLLLEKVRLSNMDKLVTRSGYPIRFGKQKFAGNGV